MNKTHTAIIVDDEPRARELLRNMLVQYCPHVQILAEAENVDNAVAAIKHNQPQTVFLDIEMPRVSGLRLPDFFNEEELNFNIVFVTAYSEFAVQAFRLSACDYLLKPVDSDDLITAVKKAETESEFRNMSVKLDNLRNSLNIRTLSKLVVTDKGSQHIIAIESIIAIEAQESYSCIHTEKGRFIASKNLKHFEKLLQQNSNLFRSHKSWLVDVNRIKNYNRSSGEINLQNDITAKLSKYKKEAFEAVLRVR